MKNNNRLGNIKEYHFKNLDIIKKKAISDGVDLIDLSIGDSNIPVDKRILEALTDSFLKEGFNKYPPYEGIYELKEAVIKYYRERYEVSLTMDEVVILIGSKEGINNVIPAVCNIGDYIIAPDPGYPVYATSALLWGCKSYKVELRESEGYLPKLSDIPEDIESIAKIFFINYPNNPTGAVATEKFYREIIKYCEKNDMVLCNDGAYNEIVQGSTKATSILQFDDNKSVIEFGSLSKPYNMTGFRIGYAVGNKPVIRALAKLKSNVDSGQFKPIQFAAIEALGLGEEYLDKIKEIYTERRIAAEEILREKNIEFFKTTGAFYIWAKTPKGYKTREFCMEILSKCGIAVAEGSIFGSSTEEYFRIALTQNKERIVEALSRLDQY
ncbi:MAG: aminotransferase class I/II-fold pyridoxal phosphate-dependent enzyme [Clostridium sp.]